MLPYILSTADAATHVPMHPERTARRDHTATLDFNVTFREWPNRASMAHSIRMQQKRGSRRDDWRAVVPLRETEGY